MSATQKKNLLVKVQDCMTFQSAHNTIVLSESIQDYFQLS